MAVSHVSTTPTVDTDGGGSISVSPPASLAAGELWVVGEWLDADPGWTLDVPSGWTALCSTIAGRLGWPQFRAFGKIAGSSESAATFTSSGGTGTRYTQWATSTRIQGQHGSSWLGNVGTATVPGAASSTVDAPDITIQDNGNLALLFVAGQGDGGTAVNITIPTGTASAYEREGIDLYPVGAFAYEARNSGSYAPGNWTLSFSDVSTLAQTIEIRAATSLSISAGLGQLTFTGYAPSVATSGSGVSISSGLGQLSISGHVPELTLTLPSPEPAALVLTGHAPSLGFERVPGLGQLTLTGFAPTFVATDNKTVSPSLGALTLTGLAPTISATASYSITPSLGQLSLTGFAPTVSASSSPSVFPDVGTLTLTGLAPSLSATDHKQVSLEAGSLTLTSFAPSMSQAGSFSIEPSVGELVLAGYAPTIELSGRRNEAGRKRRRYTVEIDGESFPVASVEEAQALLESARSAANEKAEAALERAKKAQKREPRKILADVKKALPKPVIATDAPVDVKPALQEISAIYDRVLEQITEELKRRKEEEEFDDFLFMLL